jgi:ankyrin repeat protein
MVLDPNTLMTILNEKKYKQIRPIQAAVAEGYTEKVKLLLKYNADPNLLCLNNCTTLYYASINNKTIILKILLDSKKIENINKQNEDKSNIDFSALSIAMYSGHYKSTQLLLSYGANPNIKDKYGAYPIEYIFQKKHLTLIPLFKPYLNQHHHHDYHNKGLSIRSIHHAILNCDIDLLYCLCQNGADVNYRKSDLLSPLSHAIMYQTLLKKPEILDTLLALGANPNGETAEPMLPIFAAIEINNADIIKLLLTHPKFNTKDTLPLIRAIEYGYWDCAKLIIEYIDPLTFGHTISPLFHAIYLNREEAVHIIVDFLKKENRIRDLKLHIEICSELLSFLIDDEILLDQITFKFDQILKSEEEKENWSPHFFNPNPNLNPNQNPNQNSNDISISTAFTSTSHSSHHYLLKEHGWTSEKIKSAKSELKQNLIKRKKTYPVSTSNLTSEKIFTWFEGNLDSSTLLSIEGNHSQGNCFLWLPKKEILAQGCSEILFEKFNNKSCYKFSGDHIRNLDNLNIIVPFKINGKPYYLPIKLELIIPKLEARILLFPILSDDGSAKLYLGGKFLSTGLHQNSDYQKLLKSSLSGKVYEITLPVLKPQIKEAAEKNEIEEISNRVLTYRLF